MLTEGGGGVHEPLILADVICEQPLRHILLCKVTGRHKSRLYLQLPFSTWVCQGSRAGLRDFAFVVADIVIVVIVVVVVGLLVSNFRFQLLSV